MYNLKILKKLFYLIVLIKAISALTPLHHDLKKHNSLENDHLNLNCPNGTFYTSILYPGNCTIYVECNNGQGSIKYCAPELLYDKDLGFCNEKHKVTCDYGNTTTNNNTPSNNNTNNNNYSIYINIYCPLPLLGLYPYPFSNQKYLKCVYGRLYEKSCRPNFVYNLFKKTCEKYQGNINETLPFIQKKYEGESKIRFNDSYTYLKCPSRLQGKFVDPFNCNNYINCSSVGIKIETCPLGKLFNFHEGTCQLKTTINKHVECLETKKNIEQEELYSSPLGLNCASVRVSQKYSHPDNWHKYIYCDNYGIIIKWCPRNQVFITEKQKCIDQDELPEDLF